MYHAGSRTALFALIAVLVLSLGAQLVTGAPTPTNSLAVQVNLTSGTAPAGINVTLSSTFASISCNATTGQGGYAKFANYVGAGFVDNCPALTAGWYTTTVAAQVRDVAGGYVMFTPATTVGTPFYASASNLASGFVPAPINNVAQTALNATLRGNVTANGAALTTPVKVALTDAQYPGLIISNETLLTGGLYSLPAPWGSYTVWAEGNVSTNLRYNETAVTIDHAVTYVNPSLQNAPQPSYYISGSILPTSGHFYTNQTNLTLYNPVTGTLQYTTSDSGNPYYQVAAYPSGSDLILIDAPQGYSTGWASVPVTATTAAPTENFHAVPFAHAPTEVNTVITFPSNFARALVWSNVTMTNDSTFATLPNATVGDLWAQLGLDFNGGTLTTDAAAYSQLKTWLTEAGPVYPANQMGLMVNASSFVEKGTNSETLSPLSGTMTYASAGGLNFTTGEAYNLTLPSSKWNPDAYPTYSLSVGFGYSNAAKSVNTTVKLPSGYVLAAGSAAPANTQLLPAGTGGTWTSFTIAAGMSPTPGASSGTATFTAIKYSNVTAIVNVTTTNFAFSTKNVLNQSNGNYTVVVGVGQNVSFDASHSLIPAELNATSYSWTFGDGGSNTTASSSTWYTYTRGGVWNGTLTVLGNGGQTNSTKFRVFVESTPPNVNITSNDTHGLVWYSSTDGYLKINYSQSLQFNATTSTDLLVPGVVSPAGNISVATWNISANKVNMASLNLSAGSGANVFGNETYSFLGAGPNVNSTTLPGGGPTLTFHGWVYKVLLTLWNSGGINGTKTLWVLVNDTEKPIALGSVQQDGKNVTSVFATYTQGANVTLVDSDSYAPHNGTIASYEWRVANTEQTGWYNKTYNSTTAKTVALTLPASTKEYNVTLFLRDNAGNTANVTIPLTVAINTTTNPILEAENLTVASTWTDGSSVTIMVNVTNVGGNDSLAKNVEASFYLTSTSVGPGNKANLVGGTPGSVTWYGWTSGVRNSTAQPAPTELHVNQVLEAVFSFTPSAAAGTYTLWVNASASNEFAGSYASEVNIAHTTITVNSNPIYTDLEYVAIVVVAIAIIVILVLVYRRRQAGPSKKSSSASKGGKGGSGKVLKDDDDEDEDDKAPAKGSGKDDDD